MMAGGTKMKIFLSHNMNGVSEEEIIRTREYWKDTIKNRFGPDTEFIDNYTHPDAPENARGYGTSVDPFNRCLKRMRYSSSPACPVQMVAQLKRRFVKLTVLRSCLHMISIM